MKRLSKIFTNALSKSLGSLPDKGRLTPFIRQLILSYSLILVLMFVLGIGLYSFSITSVDDRFWGENQALLEQSVSSLDSSLSLMDTLCSQISRTATVHRLVSYQEYSPEFIYAAYQAQQDLTLFIPNEFILPIRSYFIYMPGTDYILSYSQFKSSETFYLHEEHMQEDKLDSWRSLLKGEYGFRKFHAACDYQVNPSRVLYYYVTDLSTYSLSGTRASICFSIDKDRFLELFRNISFYESGFLCAVDGDGEIAFTVNDNGRSLSADTFTSLDFQDRSTCSLRLDGQRMTVLSCAGTLNGLTYYLVLPTKAASGFLRNYQLIYGLMVFVALFAGLFLSLFFSQRNLRPVSLLNDQLMDMTQNNETLKETLDQQRPHLQNAYARRLMLGQIHSSDELDYVRSYLGFPEQDQRYYVLYMLIYENEYINAPEQESLFTASDQVDYEKIQEIFKAFLGEPLYIFSPEERAYAVLLHMPLGSDDPMEIQDKVLRLHNYLLENYSIWLYGGLGNGKTYLETIWRSYDQALEAINYTNKNYIFLPYQMIRKDSGSYYYPVDFQNRMVSCITSGADEQLTSLFEIIRQENLEYRSLPNNLMEYLLSDIRNTLFRARNLIRPNEQNTERLETIDALFGKKMSMQLMEDIAHSLCKLNLASSDESQLIKEIRKFIDEKFADPSLGLTRISDQFHISESYFSHLFKETYQQNFSNYLENVRMEEASRLIRETDISLNELYLAVGYNNANTFRRAFKKIFGITPSAMRENKPSKEA
ncbi:MAG: AraC family transcriptional regulator [Lachnospiraceae bacterium]|nr:AraC family transcriptional regulator [Lachnospiraceae bacterium]